MNISEIHDMSHVSEGLTLVHDYIGPKKRSTLLGKLWILIQWVYINIFVERLSAKLIIDKDPLIAAGGTVISPAGWWLRQTWHTQIVFEEGEHYIYPTKQ